MSISVPGENFFRLFEDNSHDSTLPKISPSAKYINNMYWQFKRVHGTRGEIHKQFMQCTHKIK